MARARVYRHDVRCPHCGSNWMSKDGFDQGRQRYRGGECRRRHIPGGAWLHPSRAVKERALPLYVAGSSLSAVSRVMKVSVPAVRTGSKKGAVGPGLAGRSGAGPHRGAGRVPAGAIACDEMWTSVGCGAGREEWWTWTAVVAELDGRH